MTSAFVWRTCCSWLLSDALSAYRLPASRLLSNLGRAAFVSTPPLLSFDPAHCETSYVRHYLTDFATATFRSRAALFLRLTARLQLLCLDFSSFTVAPHDCTRLAPATPPRDFPFCLMAWANFCFVVLYSVFHSYRRRVEHPVAAFRSFHSLRALGRCITSAILVRLISNGVLFSEHWGDGLGVVGMTGVYFSRYLAYHHYHPTSHQDRTAGQRRSIAERLLHRDGSSYTPYLLCHYITKLTLGFLLAIRLFAYTPVPVIRWAFSFPHTFLPLYLVSLTHCTMRFGQVYFYSTLYICFRTRFRRPPVDHRKQEALRAHGSACSYQGRLRARDAI
jgi:hypothetical protein